MVKILDITYAKSDNASQLNSEERTLLLSLIKDFKDLTTEPFNLELKPDSKLFNSRYYPVPIMNKETFRKDLKRLV